MRQDTAYPPCPGIFHAGEELSHLELLLRFGILVVAGKVGLFEVVQPSDAGIAVVDALRRNEVLAGVYGEKYLLVDFGTHTLRYLLGDDGVHVFGLLRLKMKTPRKDALRGVWIGLSCRYCSLSVISSSRSRLKQLSAAALSLNLTSMRPFL